MKYKVIKSIEQYNRYCDLHESMMLKNEKQHFDELELLEVLIEDYDRKLDQGKMQKLNPVELLRSMIKDGGFSQVQFANEISISKQLLSDILNYRRGISKELVRKLADFFATRQEAFNRDYNLDKNSRKILTLDSKKSLSMASEPKSKYKGKASKEKENKKKS